MLSLRATDCTTRVHFTAIVVQMNKFLEKIIAQAIFITKATQI
jgi:hypothetical protein